MKSILTLDQWLEVNGCPVERAHAVLLWNAAIEEAAKACENVAGESEFDDFALEAANACVAKVRVLKA